MKRGLALAFVVFLVASMITVACAPVAPATTPTAVPAASAAPEAAKLGAATAQAAKPSASVVPKVEPATKASPAGSEQSRASDDWKAKWDTTLAAAKQEGKVVVAGGTGDARRAAVMAFQKAYPDIQLDYTGMSGSNSAPRFIAEREGGQFLWDIHMGGPTTALSTFKPKGMLDPIKPGLILPEVLDSSRWVGGLDDGWMDKEHQSVYQFDGTLAFLAYINRDVIPESELSTVDQLLDPKWKGEIISFDPRMAGAASTSAATMLMVKGEDWLRKFYSQDLVIANEGRQQAESVVRGRYPIGIRLDPVMMEQLRGQGLGGTVKPLDPNGLGAAAMTVGFGDVVLLNRAPHPNAANVFLNWLLSKDGQTAYVKEAGANSRRLDLDVHGPAETEPNPNVNYPGVGKEEAISYQNRAVEIAKEIIK